MVILSVFLGGERLKVTTAGMKIDKKRIALNTGKIIPL